MKPHLIEGALLSIPGLSALAAFAFAYLLVALEDKTGFKKSKALVWASSVIWILVAWCAHQKNVPELVRHAIRHSLLDYAELLLYIVVSVTYINVLTGQGAFESLRTWLVQKKFSYRQLFWISGILTFFISPIADNLTTALAISAVILAVGKENPSFINLSCILIVIAANAGGVFSPFGDITTLMVWQAGYLPFITFGKLFLPALLSFLIPAFLLSFALPKGSPTDHTLSPPAPRNSKSVTALFILSIFTTIFLQHAFDLPPAFGMMVGLCYLQIFCYFTLVNKNRKTISIFPAIQALDWDTLLFFYGIILSIGGLATFGYLEVFSHSLYTELGAGLTSSFKHTPGNVLVGLMSAIIDNIPLMYAIITLKPIMSEGQWLLLTLTTGVGGSLLALGSAAGVGVMGQAKGHYTFFSHLKWSWAILLGYGASVISHVFLNHASFMP